MKIAQLLEQHSKFKSVNSLELNLGDAYLYQNNSIYKNIRDAALKQGYRFSHEQNDLYLALPLSQLNNILKTKCIPYLNNVSSLKQLEQEVPGVANWHDVADNLKKNFLFHESCHAVARSQSHNLNLITVLMEESFANTCELLAVVDAEDATHKIFYEWNSYTALFEQKTNLKRAMQELGAQSFAKLIFYGYLHSNFLFESFDESQLSQVIDLVLQRKPSASEMKTIKALTRICFSLDERFKNITTDFYMRYNGIKAAKTDFRNFNYFNKIESQYADNLMALALMGK